MTVSGENLASIRVIEKCGGTLETILEEDSNSSRRRMVSRVASLGRGAAVEHKTSTKEENKNIKLASSQNQDLKLNDYQKWHTRGAQSFC